MQVDFYGYAGDCTVSGTLELTGTRLSEMLELAEDIVIRRARLYGFNGEPVKEVDELALSREDLYAVEAPGGPSTGNRRIHTVRHLLRFVAGPYRIIGEIHALPGSPPLRAVLARRSVVPLTGSAIIFDRAGQEEIRRAPVLILNGWRIDSAEPIGLDDPDLERSGLLGD